MSRDGARMAGQHLAEDLALFIDSAADQALFLSSPEGLIRSWNRGARLLTGWPAAELVGKPAGLLYPAADIPAGVPDNDRAAAFAETTPPGENWPGLGGGLAIPRPFVRVGMSATPSRVPWLL